MTRFSFYCALTTLASTYEEGTDFPATKIFLMELNEGNQEKFLPTPGVSSQRAQSTSWKAVIKDWRYDLGNLLISLKN